MLNASYFGRRRRLLDRLPDLRYRAVERIFSRAGMIGGDAKGENITVKTFREIYKRTETFRHELHELTDSSHLLHGVLKFQRDLSLLASNLASVGVL